MQKRSHRHLVAIPATMLLLLSALATHASHGRAQPAGEQGVTTLIAGSPLLAGDTQRFRVLPGVQGILEPGGNIGADGAFAMRLEAGAVTTRTAGAASMHVGDAMVVHGVRTAWYALREQSASLVVALASPIAVSVRGHMHYLQSGEQIRVPDSGDLQRSTVPQQWLQQRLGIVATLPTDAIELAGGAGHAPLEPLHDALQERRMQDAAAFLRAPAAESYLRTEQYRLLFAAILAKTATEHGADPDAIFVALQCTKALDATIPFGRLLALSYASGLVGDAQAQTMLIEQFAIDDHAAQWAGLLLQLERGRQLPLPGAFISRWAALLERVAAQDALAASALTVDAASLSVAVEERGYPVHAERWAQAARDAAAFTRSILSPGDRDTFDAALLTAFRPTARTVRASSEPVQSSAPAEPQRDPQELVALTKTALLNAGGMFATTTSFVVPPRERNAVRVLGVIFATSAGDASFDLTYHPLTDTVDKIVLQGRMFPNQLTLRQLQESL